MSQPKLKSRPEDFEVEEQTTFGLAEGPFSLYRLTKRGMGTPEAIGAIAERWRIPRRIISYGGLKDRHAVTHQWITIHKGPKRDLEQTGLRLVYQGATNRPFAAQDISGNAFRIVLRDLTESSAQQIVDHAAAIAEQGVPNYFDDQRFGSLGESGEFIARPWCLGDYERAFWLAIAEANPHDRPEDRRDKDLLRKHWGDWEILKGALPRSSRRSMVTFLCDHPTDFKRALALVRVDLRSLYLAAYQSDLWNRILAATLQEQLPAESLRSFTLATLQAPFPVVAASPELRELQLPLPAARATLEPGPLLDLYEKVLGEQGMTLRELRVKYPRDSFFSKGERAALIRPSHVKAQAAADDLYGGRSKVTLQFDLPRGAYATILVKRLTMGIEVSVS